MSLIILTTAVGSIFYGIGSFGGMFWNTEKKGTRTKQDVEGGIYVDIDAEVAHFQSRGYRHVFYARKMEKTNGTMIQCVRFYRDLIWHEYDILTGELLRSHYPYEDAITKVKKHNRYVRNKRINRRFNQTPEKIVGTKLSIAS